MTPVIPSVSDADFSQRVLEADVPVLVEFWAEWCGSCRQMLPVLASLQEDFGDRLAVMKAKIDECPEVVQSHQIAGTPTTIQFKNGEAVHRIAGARPKPRIRAELDKLL